MKTSRKVYEKSFTNINTKSFVVVVCILLSMMIVTWALTYFIPQGGFQLGEGGEILPGTFESGVVSGMSFLKLLGAPLLVFGSSDGLSLIMISLFLLIMAGVFNIIEKTNGVRVFIDKTAKKYAKKKFLILTILVLVFMAYGSFFGMFEELVALMPMVIMLTIFLGYDTLTGMTISMVASCFGFASAITNPFSVGLASSIAGVSLANGILLRILLFGVIFVILMVFLLIHVKRISKNPSKSPTFASDEQKRLEYGNNITVVKDENKIMWTYVTFFLIQVATILIVSMIPAISGYSVPILCLTFLAGGITCGVVISKSFKYTMVTFLKGARSMLPAVVMIALAGSIKYILSEGNILHTIMNSVIGLLQGQSAFACLLMIYGLILLLQIFIGSASAKVILIMPIILPICQAVGIPPALAILTYCMADGFTDVILPTNPVLLVGLSMAGVSYGKWIRHTWLLQLIVLVVTIGMIGLGVAVMM